MRPRARTFGRGRTLLKQFSSSLRRLDETSKRRPAMASAPPTLSPVTAKWKAVSTVGAIASTMLYAAAAPFGLAKKLLQPLSSSLPSSPSFVALQQFDSKLHHVELQSGSVTEYSYLPGSGFGEYWLIIALHNVTFGLVDDKQVIFVMVPGNPGCVNFYHDYAEHLHRCAAGKMNIVVVGHLGTLLAPCCASRLRSSGHSVSSQTTERHSLVDQVNHKTEFVAHLMKQHPDARFVLAGHSVGAYICTEIMRTLPAEKVLKAVLLFPTVSNIGLVRTCRHRAASPSPSSDPQRAQAVPGVLLLGGVRRPHRRSAFKSTGLAAGESLCSIGSWSHLSLV